jgi:hypothetical protein
MSYRPTLETDAAAWVETNQANALVLASFACNLERQRDEARELARELRDALKKCAGVCSGEVMNKNALINALESARLVLTKAKEVLP